MNDLSEISIRSATNADCANVQALVFGILEEYGLKPDLAETDKDITDIEAHYLERGGIFELIENADGTLFGTVGLYPLNETTVELRKMYLSSKLRGKGVGKRTLQRVIEKSKELDFKKIYLETASVLKEAIGLYEKFGFTPTCEKHTPRCDRAYFMDIA